MPQWALWLIFILSVLMTAIPQGLLFQIDEIKEALSTDEKIFCRYCVLDVESEKIIVSGEKYKQFQNMKWDRKFFSYFHIVFEFSRYKTVGDRTCLVLYWVNAPKLRPRKNLVRVVTASGKKIGIK